MRARDGEGDAAAEAKRKALKIHSMWHLSVPLGLRSSAQAPILLDVLHLCANIAKRSLGDLVRFLGAHAAHGSGFSDNFAPEFARVCRLAKTYGVPIGGDAARLGGAAPQTRRGQPSLTPPLEPCYQFT